MQCQKAGNQTTYHILDVNMNNRLYSGTIQSSGIEPVFLPNIESYNKTILISHSSNLSDVYIAGLELRPNQTIDIKVGNLNYLYISSNSGQVNNISFIGS